MQATYGRARSAFHTNERIGEKKVGTSAFPALILEDWRATRDALHDYARVIGYCRRELMPPQKHWWHITLSVSAHGLTTTPIPSGPGAVELTLDPSQHRIEVAFSDGRALSIPLVGQSASDLGKAIGDALRDDGIQISANAAFSGTEYEYDRAAASHYWSALVSVDLAFKEFKGTLREETGPVHIFPHHFDVSLNWFSGRRVPDVDPADAENADEQMNFGFVTGDGSFADAYFYATAYPLPGGLTQAELPEGAYWHSEGFTGAVLPYAAIAESRDGRERLLDFLSAAQQAGAERMR